MEFFFLGTGTLVPEGDRGPSGYALRGAEPGLALIDGGTGTLGRLAGIGIDFREIRHALYTHRHPDHTADLVPLLFARKYVPNLHHEWEELDIHGPPGFPAFVARLQEAWQGWATPGDDVEVRLLEVPADHGAFRVLGLEVRAWPVDHSDPGAVAYRFEDPETGGSLCYSGDTQFCDGIVEAARDVDVLVLECSFPDDQAADGHLTPSSAARVAHLSGARRVLLTHVYPVAPREQVRMDCERALGRPVELAHQGHSILL